MDIVITQLIKSLYKAWKKGTRSSRLFISLSSALFITSITLGILNYQGLITDGKNAVLDTIAITLAILSFFSLLIPISKELYEEQESVKTEIRDKEQKLKENPEEIKLAWDIATIRLEGYLKKNLAQVTAIFWFSLLATGFGLGLITYGSYKAFQNPENINPSIIVTIAGAVVNFLGATLLVIHRYTMEQANQYVQVLERINAVGMSVQIMETIHENELKLKEETKAEISKKLLELYGSKNPAKNEDKKESQSR